MKKVWCTALAAVAIASNLGFAQPQQPSTNFGDETVKKEIRNEVSVWGLGGISSFMYNPNVGSMSLGFGGGGGVGVGRFFMPNLGVRFGLEFMTYASEFKAPSFTTAYALIDVDGDPFEYRADFYNYKEKQKAMMINIPITACYEQGWLYAQLGLKLGLGINSTYNATADSIVTSGYYSAMNVTYHNLPSYGFTTYNNTKTDGNLSLGLNLALAAEVGVKWKLNNRLNLYTGIYADYGLLNVSSKKNEQMIDYIGTDVPVEKHSFNSMLHSSLSNSFGEKNFVDRVGVLGAGVKVTLGINTTTLLASANKSNADDAYQADNVSNYSNAKSTEVTKEEKRQLQAEKEEQEKAAKEQEKAAKEQAKAQEKAEKEKQKAEKQATKEKSKLSPRQQQMEDDIAELKRVQEILMQQAESNNRNQEAILGAVKAAQDAATAAADAARAAQTAVMSMQGKDRAAEKKALTAARKDANHLSFKIQISARRSKLDDVNAPFAKYGLEMKITEERYEDDTKTYVYKYVVGSYKQVDAAVEACNVVRDKGIKDAFVVAYYRGNRITMAEAFNMLNKN